MSARAPVSFAASIAVAFLFELTGSFAATAVNQGEVLAPDPGAAVNSVLRAWRRADAQAIAAQYEPDGDFISPTGERAVGPGAIEAFYRAAFEAGYAGSDATATVVHVRTIAPSLALVDGYWSIHPTAASRIKEPESGLFFAVLRWHDAHWLILALREQTSATELRELSAGLEKASASQRMFAALRGKFDRQLIPWSQRTRTADIPRATHPLRVG